MIRDHLFLRTASKLQSALGGNFTKSMSHFSKPTMPLCLSQTRQKSEGKFKIILQQNYNTDTSHRLYARCSSALFANLTRRPSSLVSYLSPSAPWPPLSLRQDESSWGACTYDVRKIFRFFDTCPSPLSLAENFCQKSADFVPFVCYLVTPSPSQFGRHMCMLP